MIEKDEELEESMPSGLSNKKMLTGMYQNWFLDYASYVILDRAVPHIYDGLKPVQRRILHSMKRMEDGRYNKVANIVGHTMQFHPHGDSSIYEAMVRMAQTFSMVGVKLFQLACVSFITAKWLLAFLPAVVKLYVFSSASVPRIFIL